MPVIKEFQPRTREILTLEAILQTLDDDEQYETKRYVLNDLKRIKRADAGKRKASAALARLYKDREDAILINGLRLEEDGQVIQLDHIAIHADGQVGVFETRNFSSGLKIDEQGQFWRWHGFKKKYIEMTSPLIQGQRNFELFKPILAQQDFNAQGFHHLIVVDDKARVQMPNRGYDYVCRAQDLMARMQGSGGALGGIINWVKQMFAKRFSLQELQAVGDKLIALNRPANIDYADKYGLQTVPNIEIKDIEQMEAALAAQPRIERLTLPKLSRVMNISTRELEARLFEQGYLEPKGYKTFVTDKGKAIGIQFRKGRRGFFFLVPASMAEQADMQQAAQAQSPRADTDARANESSENNDSINNDSANNDSTSNEAAVPPRSEA